MSKGASKKKSINKDSWMNTYSDMVTLLLCFFVLLFASSSLDSSKFQILVEQLNPSLTTMAEKDSAKSAGSADIQITTSGGGLVKDINDFSGLADNIDTYVKENNLAGSVKVVQGEGYVFIVFQNSVFFDGDKHELRPEGKQVLDFLCSGLSKVNSDIEEIQVHGHTNQADPGHPNAAKGDWMLSADRAAEVVAYMQSKNFMDPKGFEAIGHGQYYPAAPFVGEKNRSQNRRVEILIQEKGSVSKTLDEIYADMKKEEKSGTVVAGDVSPTDQKETAGPENAGAKTGADGKAAPKQGGKATARPDQKPAKQGGKAAAKPDKKAAKQGETPAAEQGGGAADGSGDQKTR